MYLTCSSLVIKWGACISQCIFLSVAFYSAQTSIFLSCKLQPHCSRSNHYQELKFLFLNQTLCSLSLSVRRFKVGKCCSFFFSFFFNQIIRGDSKCSLAMFFRCKMDLSVGICLLRLSSCSHDVLIDPYYSILQMYNL